MSHKMKFLTSFLIIAVFFVISSAGSFAEFQTPAKEALLMEFSTGTIVYDKDTDKPVPPASITKLMTLLLGFEAVESGLASWDDEVYVSEKAWKTQGSRMFLEVNSKVSYREIINGISVVSANDGCVALAEHLYGSVSSFVQVMNQRAGQLGLINTNYKNPHGLPEEGHYMSARDIAELARYLIQKFPQILEIESMREMTFNNIKQFNRNPLLGVFPGADGLKTGWTNEAGYCLVGTAQQDSIRFISVILNAKDEVERLTATQDLLSYGFKSFGIFTVIEAGKVVEEIEVEKGKELSVPVKVDNDISLVLPIAKKDEIKAVAILSEKSLKAPVNENIVVGKVEIQLDGKVLADTTVSTAGSVEKAGFFQLLIRFIKNIFN